MGILWPSPRVTASAPARPRWPCSAAAATASPRILRHHRHRHGYLHRRHRLSISRPLLAAAEAPAAVVTFRASTETTCLRRMSARASATRNRPASATSFTGTLASVGYWDQDRGKDQSTGFWVRPARRLLRMSTRGGAISTDFATVLRLTDLFRRRAYSYYPATTVGGAGGAGAGSDIIPGHHICVQRASDACGSFDAINTACPSSRSDISGTVPDTCPAACAAVFVPFWEQCETSKLAEQLGAMAYALQGFYTLCSPTNGH